MSQQELIEKYLAELCERTDDFYKHEFENVLTRLLAEYDAQKGVEGDKKSVEDTREAILKCVWITDGHLLCNQEKIDALIARHAPKGVDVEKAWELLSEYRGYPIDHPVRAVMLSITKEDLAAALVAAQGEK